MLKYAQNSSTIMHHFITKFLEGENWLDNRMFIYNSTGLEDFRLLLRSSKEYRVGVGHDEFEKERNWVWG